MIFQKSIFIVFLFATASVAGWIFLSAHKPVPADVSNLKIFFAQSEPTEEVFGEQPVQPIKILFGGDMMFDRYIRTVMRRHGDGFPLAPLQETLQSADLVVANLEGPITESASVSETSAFGARENYVFTFPSATAGLLKDEHIDIVSLGNNHILNFKESGVESTKRYLAEAGVGQFGSPLAGDDRIAVRDLGGMRIAFVSYNQFVFQGKEKALEDIAWARKEADIVILYTHWGKEYEPVLPSVRELAHQFIDAGVDAIIGSHPHVIQEKEAYSGKTIYYSLGNFVFDQYFEEGTMRGLLVRMSIDPKTKALSFEDIPIALRTNGQTVVEK
jgi:poly-gamma-glutamate synthesis protein (capsule biosynthesis protein)